MVAVVHVVPLGDHIVHDVPGGLGEYDGVTFGWAVVRLSAAEEAAPELVCVCGPALEHCPGGVGPDGWMVVHHSLDGREARECGAARPHS